MYYTKKQSRKQCFSSLNGRVVQQKDKINKSVMIVGGTVGLLTIGMAIFSEMRDLWKTSKDLDADLRNKTTEFVKYMMG